MSLDGGRLITGARDKTVVITNLKDWTEIKCIDFGSVPRAIDCKGDNMLVGLRTGSIIETNCTTGDQTTLMQSHNDGEIWGLSQGEGCIITSGDDNHIKKWDVAKRCCTDTAEVSGETRRAKRNRASTLGTLAES